MFNLVLFNPKYFLGFYVNFVFFDSAFFQNTPLTPPIKHKKKPLISD